MSTETGTFRRMEGVADLGLVASALLSIPVLGVWLSGLGEILAQGRGLGAMAPGPALAFSMAAALAVRLRCRSGDRISPPGLRWAWLAWAAAALPGLLGLVAAFANPTGFPGGWFFGLGGPGSVTTGTRGVAGVHAAILLSLVPLALRLAFPGSAGARRAAQVAAGLLAVAGIALIARDVRAGPPEAGSVWWSGWVCLLLGIGLAGTADNPFGPSPIGGHSGRPWGRGPLAVALGVTVVLGGLAAAGLRLEQRAFLAARMKELQTILDLKAGQITNWCGERLLDGRFFANAPFAARDVAAMMTVPPGPRAREEALGWLRLIKAGDRYDRVILYNAARQPVLSVTDDPAAPLPDLPAPLAESLRRDRVRLTDLEREPDDGKVRMRVVFSVLPPGPDGAAESPPGAEPMGYVVLRLDPSRFLHPLVRAWPTPSDSAESILLRREGDAVTVLTPLRFRPEETVPFQIPSGTGDARTNQLALASDQGGGEGRDYRGHRTLATWRAVPGTPWHLVAKVDWIEVCGGLGNQALLVFGLVLGLAGLAGLVSGLYLLRRNHAFERQRLALAERLALLMRQANDIILVFDEDWRVVESNERARTAYGYTEEELRGLTLRDLSVPDSRAPLAPEPLPSGVPSAQPREAMHRRKGGATFPVEVSEQHTRIGRRTYRQVIVRDITERHEKDARLRRANRSLRTLSAVGRAVVRNPDEPSLLEEVCRIIVDEGGYRMAWVGFAENDPEGSVRPVASAGSVDGYLETVRATWRDTERGGGPSGLAIRTGRPCVIHDLEKDARFAPWRDEAVKRGYRSSIALPLRAGGHLYGALRIYSDVPDTFDAEEERLLLGLADDVAYGIRALRVQAERDRAMESLGRREELFRCLFASHVVGILVADDAGRVTEANDTFLQLAGYAREDLPIDGRRLAPGEENPDRDAGIVAALARGDDLPPEEREYLRKDGTRIPVLLGVARIPGERPGMVGFVLDLRERRAADAALRASEERYRRLFEGNPHPMWVFDPETLALLAVNDAMVATYGWSREELLAMTLRDLRPPEEGPRLLQELEAIRDGRQRPGTGRHRRKDGTELEVESVSHSVTFAGRRAEVVLAQDVTERRRLEREREGMQMRLQQQAKLEAIGTLASGVAHEINNPVNGVMNFAQLILDDTPACTPTAEYAAEILNEAGRVAEIVRNLLQFARQERRAMVPMRLTEVVGATLSLMRTVLRHDHILIDLRIPADLPPARARMQQVQQILMSLLTNARDALNERHPGPHPDKRIILSGSVVSREGRTWLRLSVEDFGTGIDPAHRDLVFRPYFTTKPPERGSGLGLTLSQDLAREHGGELRFESEPGVGTRFHLDLPLDAPAADDGESVPVLVDDD